MLGISTIPSILSLLWRALGHTSKERNQEARLSQINNTLEQYPMGGLSRGVRIRDGYASFLTVPGLFIDMKINAVSVVIQRF